MARITLSTPERPRADQNLAEEYAQRVEKSRRLVKCSGLTKTEELFFFRTKVEPLGT